MTDQKFLQEYEAALAKAQNPATPAEELDALWRFSKKQRGSYRLIQEVLAKNPNLSSKTFQEACVFERYHTVCNPIIPLLVLESAWMNWDQWAFNYLRETAFETKQDFFPMLTKVCYTEWRRERQIYSQEPTYHQEVCGSEFCATCFPYNTARMIERWRAMRGK